MKQIPGTPAGMLVFSLAKVANGLCRLGSGRVARARDGRSWEGILKKKPTEIVSAAGFLASFFTELDREVRQAGGTDADWHRLVTPEGKSDLTAMANIIVRRNTSGLYVVEIQPVTLGELIRLGNYDWVNSDITVEHFPLDNSQFGNFELVLVHLNRSVTSDEVLLYMDDHGLSPAKIGHLLAFGAKYPNVQREFPIIALGSSWVSPFGGRVVPYLDVRGSGRALRLLWPDSLWGDCCRFLALRK